MVRGTHGQLPCAAPNNRDGKGTEEMEILGQGHVQRQVSRAPEWRPDLQCASIHRRTFKEAIQVEGGAIPQD